MFGAECDIEVCSFEDICDVCGFSAYVCEIGPFLGGAVGCEFVGLGVGILCGFIGKELLWRMLCIVFSSCWYSLCCNL